MIVFSAYSVLNSILFSFFYGAFCATLSLVCALLFRLTRSFGRIASTWIKYNNGIFSRPREIFIEEGRIKSVRVLREVGAFFKVLLFTIGFILISYISLDGEIRIYTLAVSLASYLLLRSFFLSALLSFLLIGLEALVSYLSVILRIFLYIPVRTVKSVKKLVFRRKYIPYDSICLDKREIK